VLSISDLSPSVCKYAKATCSDLALFSGSCTSQFSFSSDCNTVLSLVKKLT
jgi:hypothetical protein